MKRMNRKPYKTEVISKPFPNTKLERLKRDYIAAKKNANKNLVYKTTGKEQHKLKRRRSAREYLRAKEEKEREKVQREIQQFENELSKL